MDRLLEIFNQLPKINFRDIFFPIEESEDEDEDEYIYEQLSKGKSDYFENDDTIPLPPSPSPPSLPLENVDKYAFILIGCHGAIPVKCTINPNGTKNLDIVVASNREMVLTQFIESAAGCVGFLSNYVRQNMFRYLGEQLEVFYNILQNNPMQVTPEKTYKFFVNTAYNLQTLYRGNLFNQPMVKNKSMNFDDSIIKIHNETLDYANMQYISKNFIEKIYLVKKDELINNHGVYLYTKDYPQGINIFNEPELIRIIQEFEKELTDINYDGISWLKKEEPNLITLFSIMRYLESIGITKTYLHDTSCSTLLSVRQPGEPREPGEPGEPVSCNLTDKEIRKVTIKIRQQIALNEEQRQQYKEYFRQQKKRDPHESDTTESEPEDLKRYPSVGSLGLTTEDQRINQIKIPKLSNNPSNFLTSNTPGTGTNNPLQKYPTKDLIIKYNKQNISEDSEDSDTEIDEPLIKKTKRTRKNINKELLDIWGTKKRRKPKKTGGKKHLSRKRQKRQRTLKRKNKK
jgi:hypothetical protein